jgi:copper transport protein
MTTPRDHYFMPRLRGARSCLLALTCSLLLAIALISPQDVHAHAVLESTVPADGAAVTPSPVLITLNFSEAVSPVFARVLDRDGKPVTAPSDASSVNNQLHIRIPRALPDGPYMVTYRIVSADTHPVGGAFPFVVGTAAAPLPGKAVDDKMANDAAWTRLIVLNHALHLAALLLVVGAGSYLLLIEGRLMPSRRTLAALHIPLATLGVITAVTAVGLQGALMVEAPLAGLLADGTAANGMDSIWKLGAMTTRGTSSLAAVIGLLLMAAGFSLRNVVAARLCLIAGIVAGMASLVVAGHAATVEPRWAALPAWIVHTAIATFWIGSLLPLLNDVAPFRIASPATAHDEDLSDPPGALRAFGAFSRIALPGLLAMLAGGVVMATLQCGVETLASFDISTRYATVLLIKIALVVLLLGLAMLNRFVLVPRLALHPSDTPARHALRNAVAIELLVGVAVIVAAAILSQQPPPAALRHALPLHASAPATVEQTLVSEKGYRARLRMTHQPNGNFQMDVQLSNAKGELLTPIAVNLELANGAAGIEPLERKLVAATDGSREFRYSGRDLVVPGQWSVHIDAVITDFEQSAFSTTVNIPPR